MDIALGYDVLATLHAAAQDAENIHANAATHIHHLLCLAFETSAPGDCICGVPQLLAELDAAARKALLDEVRSLTGLTEADLAPVLALDVGGRELFAAGWRTAYPHLKVLCELRDRAAVMDGGDQRERRQRLLAPHGGHPTAVHALLADLAPADSVDAGPRPARKSRAVLRPAVDAA